MRTMLNRAHQQGRAAGARSSRLEGGRRWPLFVAFLLVCFSLSSFEARAAWREAGNVTAVAPAKGGAIFTLSSGARVSVTFVTPNVVRVRLAPQGTFERDFSYAVEEKERPAPHVSVMGETGRTTTMSAADGASVRVRRVPFLIEIEDGRGRTVVADDPARPYLFDAQTGAVETSKLRSHLEMYYGFGEKALPFSRVGQAMVMWNTDTYAYAPGLDPIYQSEPFFIALKQGAAYGIFFDNTSRTYFDMGKTAPARYTFGAPAGELNYYVFTGGVEGSPKKVLADYTELTGRTPLPPLWALGYQQSRYSYYPESKVREIARGFRERKIPADVIYLDIDYMDGYRVFTWDAKNFPDPPRMLSDLKNDGFRTVVIIDPGIKVDEGYAVYREGRDGGYFVKTADGQEHHARVWPGICAFPDFTDPRTRAWFGSLYRKNLDEGISGFWNDMNEPGTFPPENRPPQPWLAHDPEATFPLNVRHAADGHAGDHARYHNVYGMQMARSTFEGLKRLRPDERPFVLTRAGYSGVQRYSAVWTGDNVATWEHFRLSISMLLNMGVSGIPFVGADVGGFASNATPELYTRWLQAAALTPFFRTHVGKGLQDREPWSFGDEHTRINRASIELRYRLLPYIYTLFREHEQTGMPVMRPLWFEYPSDINTYWNDNQFLLGRELLVAPVMQEGAVKRPVYFPKGDAWVDWWTGRRYEGGTTAEIEAPLERLPLFLRAGSAVPLQAVIQHTGETARAPLSLVVAAGRDGGSLAYEDAGNGYGYQRARNYRLTAISLEGNTLHFRASGEMSAPRPFHSVEWLGLDARPREVRVDGREVKSFDYEKDEKRLRIRLLEPVEREVSIVP